MLKNLVDRNEKINDVTAFLLEHHTYFDSSVLMLEGFAEFLRSNFLSFRASNLKIYILYPTVHYLEALSEGENTEKATAAQRAIGIVQGLVKYGIADLVGHAENRFHESQQLLIETVKYRTKRSLAFVTCNRKLQNDLVMQNGIRSFNGEVISVLYLTRSGNMYRCFDETEQTKCISAETDEDDDLLKLFNIA